MKYKEERLGSTQSRLTGRSREAHDTIRREDAGNRRGGGLKVLGEEGGGI